LVARIIAEVSFFVKGDSGFCHFFDKLAFKKVVKKNLPKVGFVTMNEVHYEEVELISELFKAIEADTEARSATEIFEKLPEHMLEHFSYEESMLKNRDFGMYDIHHNDHTASWMKPVWPI